MPRSVCVTSQCIGGLSEGRLTPSRACVMPALWPPGSSAIGARVPASYSAATPEYAPAASMPDRSGLYARHEMMPAVSSHGIASDGQYVRWSATPSIKLE